MEVKSIKDVSNGVIQKNIMVYLSNYDVKSFGMTGSKRFKVIADDELEKRPTRILISCGWTTDGPTSKSGILSLRQNFQGSLQATYEPGHDYFTSMKGGFGVNCNGRIICGAGGVDFINPLKKVFEFRDKNFVEIKPLKTRRVYCSSLYIPPSLENDEGLLLVAGSWDGEGGNTMEYLMINNDLQSNHWNVCDDKLPCNVRYHQMNLLHTKLILTGGFINGSYSKKVWQGIISFNQQLRVNWSPLPQMMESRHGHVAIVMKEKLFCIGGGGKKSSEYFSFETKRWLKGPDLPFTLIGAKAVLTNQQNQCLLLGGRRDGKESANISLFDPIKGVERIEGCLDIPRSDHIAVLL